MGARCLDARTFCVGHYCVHAPKVLKKIGHAISSFCHGHNCTQIAIGGAILIIGAATGVGLAGEIIGAGELSGLITGGAKFAFVVAGATYGGGKVIQGGWRNQKTSWISDVWSILKGLRGMR